MKLAKLAKSPTLAAAFTAVFVVLAIYAIASQLGERVHAEERREQNAIALAVPSQDARPGSLLDSFEGSNAGKLGDESRAGMVWLSLGDGFDVRDGLAIVNSSSQGETTMALVDTKWADAEIGATAGNVVTGSGIVFRFQDLQNFWSLVAVPDFATWNLQLYRDGEIAGVWKSGLSSVEPGTELSVVTIDDEIHVFIDREQRISIVDPTFRAATVAGLISTTGSGASFSVFGAKHNDAQAASE
jgi:hypothetical protein